MKKKLWSSIIFPHINLSFLKYTSIMQIFPFPECEYNTILNPCCTSMNILFKLIEFQNIFHQLLSMAQMAVQSVLRLCLVTKWPDVTILSKNVTVSSLSIRKHCRWLSVVYHQMIHTSSVYLSKGNSCKLLMESSIRLWRKLLVLLLLKIIFTLSSQ